MVAVAPLEKENPSMPSRSKSQVTKLAADATESHDVSAQRARKRALDREAQRNFRKKTKDHINQLEKVVENFRTQNKTQLVDHLWSENAQLRKENETLRKSLGDIGVLVQHSTMESSPMWTDVIDPNCQGQGYQDGRRDSSIAVTDYLVEGDTSVMNTWTAQQPEMSYEDAMDVAQMINSDAAMSPSAYDGQQVYPCDHTTSLSESQRPQHTQARNASPGHDFAHMPSLAQLQAMNRRAMAIRAPRPIHTSHRSTPKACDEWQTTLRIFGKIFDFSREQALQARNVEAGSLFVGIRQGWNALSFEQQVNPVVQVVKEYDEYFNGEDPVNRIAMAYKNHLLIKYLLNSDPDDWENIPDWHRPRQSQTRRKHEFPLDLFAWPMLRERFISGHSDVYATKAFAAAYHKNFHFAWPFSFDETFRYDACTRQYTPSPLFKRYHTDLRFWRMKPAFFEQFPELAQDMNAGNPTAAAAAPRGDGLATGADGAPCTAGCLAGADLSGGYGVSAMLYDMPNMV